MDQRQERRAYPRMAATLAVDCRPLDDEADPTHRTVTQNVGSGGLYFETEAADFVPGSRWAFTLAVPPGQGHFPYPGRVLGVGQVCRVTAPTSVDDDPTAASAHRGVAIRFERPLKLVFQDQ